MTVSAHGIAQFRFLLALALLSAISACGGGGGSASPPPPPPVTIKSIAITPNPATSGISMMQQLAATGTYSDGSTKDVTKIATWSSSTPSVATIGPTTAIVTGASLGSTTISAAIGTVTGTEPLSVVARWLPTSMTTARDGNTSTLLPNGKVLVAGGDGNIASAELYDPSAGSWTATGSMATARSGHTATLLPNGKVLVAGGVGPGNGFGGAVATAELYDPSTGTWSATGSMTTARNAHTATLLPDGSVLVTGGADGIVVTGAAVFSTAEIYSPSAGTWTATGSMTSARVGDTATSLPSGAVLVAGGIGTGLGNNYLATAEIYDPSAGSWTPTGSMSTQRYEHTATLLSNGTVLVGDGVVAAANYMSAEIFDPSTGTWTATGSMTTPRESATATLLRNGTVLVAGGTFNGRTPLASAEIYDPSTGTWTATADMAVMRIGQTATLLPNGEVLVAGGVSIATAELYE
jgi:N-acetylneuraminic acid mutarotase